MRLRNKLEELGKMKGVNQDEKGLADIMLEPCRIVIVTFY